MTKSLWDKYKGKKPTLEEIYRDDFLPLVKKGIAETGNKDESIFKAIDSMNCQLPFSDVVPLSWISKARAEI